MTHKSICGYKERNAIATAASKPHRQRIFRFLEIAPPLGPTVSEPPVVTGFTAATSDFILNTFSFRFVTWTNDAGEEFVAYLFH